MQIQIRYGIKQEDALQTRPDDAMFEWNEILQSEMERILFLLSTFELLLWFHGRTCIGLTQNLNIHQNQYDCSARYFMEIVISNAIVILNFILKKELENENTKKTFMGNDFCCIMRSVFLWRRCSHSSFVLFS